MDICSSSHTAAYIQGLRLKFPISIFRLGCSTNAVGRLGFIFHTCPWASIFSGPNRLKQHDLNSGVVELNQLNNTIWIISDAPVESDWQVDHQIIVCFHLMSRLCPLQVWSHHKISMRTLTDHLGKIWPNIATTWHFMHA